MSEPQNEGDIVQRIAAATRRAVELRDRIRVAIAMHRLEILLQGMHSQNLEPLQSQL
jgi:hypothetical protein